MHRLIWVFAGHASLIVGLIVRWLLWLALPFTWPGTWPSYGINGQWATRRENVPSDMCAQKRQMSHFMIKATQLMCDQRRLRSDWASTMSDQSLRCASLSSEGPQLSSCGQRRLWLDWADAQCDLSFRLAHMPFCWFCHELAQISLHIIGYLKRAQWRFGLDCANAQADLNLCLALISEDMLSDVSILMVFIFC